MNTTLIEHSEQGGFPIDIFTKLSHHRILFLNDYIDQMIAVDFAATLLLKDMESSKEKISIYINSEHGDIRSIMTIYDTMRMIAAPIETVCCGTAMNEVVLLLAAGTKGMRYATSNAVISGSQLIHDQSYMSDLTDAKTVMDCFAQDNKKFMSALAKATNKKLSQVMKDFERKKFFNAEQAKKYGIVDEILTKK